MLRWNMDNEDVAVIFKAAYRHREGKIKNLEDDEDLMNRLYNCCEYVKDKFSVNLISTHDGDYITFDYINYNGQFPHKYYRRYNLDTLEVDETEEWEADVVWDEQVFELLFDFDPLEAECYIDECENSDWCCGIDFTAFRERCNVNEE